MGSKSKILKQIMHASSQSFFSFFWVGRVEDEYELTKQECFRQPF